MGELLKKLVGIKLILQIKNQGKDISTKKKVNLLHAEKSNRKVFSTKGI
jgi:hypothetical protein